MEDSAAPGTSDFQDAAPQTRRRVRQVQDRVYAALANAGLGPDDLIVAAVSGGPDSMTLLDCLVAARRRGGPAVHVAHLNHGLRAEAAQVAEAVVGHARDAGLPVTAGTPHDYPVGETERMPSEDAARRARWMFLRDVARRVGAVRIATGHTRNDQAETVIMNLARGSGLRGLAGMRANDGEILRPLLAVSRRDTAAYVQARQLVVDPDPLNETPRFRRNRIRLEVLPLLDEIYPGVVNAIARSAEVLAGEIDGLPLYVQSADGRRMPLHPERAAVPEGLFPGTLVAAVRALGGRRQIGAASLGAVARALSEDTHGRWVDLTADTHAFVRDGAVVLYPERARDATWRPPVSLTVPGEARVPGGSVVAELITGGPPWGHGVAVDGSTLDHQRLQGRTLTLRAPAPHERVHPARGEDTRDLARLLRSRGVTADIAASIPVLDVDGAAVCVPGVWRDHGFAPRPDARTVVALRARWDAIRPPEARA